MTCPKCNGRTRVLETRESPHGTRRRRECRSCGRRFTTFEAVVARVFEQRVQATADVPDAAEIAQEVADAFEDQFRISDVLDALPDAVVEALLVEADARRDLANGHHPELIAGDDDE